MIQSMDKALAQIQLKFEEKKKVREDLSAVVLTSDGNLWLASDETATIERLTCVDETNFGKQKRFQLGNLLGFSNLDENDEIDIEGLAYAEPYLWVVGSHSSKRTKPRGILFSVKKEYSHELDEKRLSRELRSEFKTNNIPLSENDDAIEVKIKERGKEWEIKDKPNDKEYQVRQGKLKDGQQVLKVCDETIKVLTYDEDFDRLAEIDLEPKRHLLARIPLVDQKLHRSYTFPDGHTLAAAQLQRTETLSWLKQRESF